MEKRLYGLTTADVRKLVFTFCEKRAIANPFNEQGKAAGRCWLKMFLSRHQELAIRKPEAVSIQRAAGFNSTKADIFYELLQKTVFSQDVQRLIPQSNIYIVDETGFSVVQKPSKIIAEKQKICWCIDKW